MRLLCLLVAFLAWTTAQMARAETWLIVCEESLPPYNFLENDRLVGLDAELVAAIARQAGAEPRIETRPWSRVQRMLETGEVDAAFQFVGRPDRFENYIMVGPYRIGQTVFASRPGATITFERLEDLRPYRIGMINGYTYSPAFDAATFLDKNDIARENRQLVRMLDAARVDLIIGDRGTLTYFAAAEGLRERIVILPRSVAEVPRYIAVPQNKPDVAARMGQALAKLRGNGGLAAIQARWE